MSEVFKERGRLEVYVAGIKISKNKLAERAREFYEFAAEEVIKMRKYAAELKSARISLDAANNHNFCDKCGRGKKERMGSEIQTIRLMLSDDVEKRLREAEGLLDDIKRKHEILSGELGFLKYDLLHAVEYMRMD